MPRAKKPNQSDLSACGARLKERAAARDDLLIESWPVLLRAGDPCPLAGNGVWSEYALCRLADLWTASTLRYRASDRCLVIDPAELEGLTCDEASWLRMRRDDLIWGTAELWKDRDPSYAGVWLLIYSLLGSDSLLAGELLNALQTASIPSKVAPTEVLSVTDNLRAESAHRLVQAFLLKE
jgi:hypothetical protein